MKRRDFLKRAMLGACMAFGVASVAPRLIEEEDDERDSIRMELDSGETLVYYDVELESIVVREGGPIGEWKPILGHAQIVENNMDAVDITNYLEARGYQVPCPQRS